MFVFVCLFFYLLSFFCSFCFSPHFYSFTTVTASLAVTTPVICSVCFSLQLLLQLRTPSRRYSAEEQGLATRAAAAGSSAQLAIGSHTPTRGRPDPGPQTGPAGAPRRPPWGRRQGSGICPGTPDSSPPARHQLATNSPPDRRPRTGPHGRGTPGPGATRPGTAPGAAATALRRSRPRRQLPPGGDTGASGAPGAAAAGGRAAAWAPPLTCVPARVGQGSVGRLRGSAGGTCGVPRAGGTLRGHGTRGTVRGGRDTRGSPAGHAWLPGRARGAAWSGARRGQRGGSHPAGPAPPPPIGRAG